MSLTDLMSSMQLTVWPEIALVIFLAVFLTVAFRAFRSSARAEHEEAGLLPLEDDASPGHRGEA